MTKRRLKLASFYLFCASFFNGISKTILKLVRWMLKHDWIGRRAGKVADFFIEKARRIIEEEK